MRNHDQCDLPRIPADELENIIFSYAKKAFMVPDVFVRNLIDQKNLKSDLEEATKKLAKITKETSSIESKQEKAAMKMLLRAIGARRAAD